MGRFPNHPGYARTEAPSPRFRALASTAHHGSQAALISCHFFYAGRTRPHPWKRKSPCITRLASWLLRPSVRLAAKVLGLALLKVSPETIFRLAVTAVDAPLPLIGRLRPLLPGAGKGKPGKPGVAGGQALPG